MKQFLAMLATQLCCLWSTTRPDDFWLDSLKLNLIIFFKIQ